MTRECVARRVAYRIGFGLDDPPADPALWKVVDQGLADQEACELDRVDGQVGSANTPDASGPCWRRVCIHAIAQLTAEPFARRARPDTIDENASRPSTPGKSKLTAKSYQVNEYQKAAEECADGARPRRPTVVVSNRAAATGLNRVLSAAYLIYHSRVQLASDRSYKERLPWPLPVRM